MKLHKFSLVALALFSIGNTALADSEGGASGGGMPRLPTAPSEPFEYLCNLNLSEQRGNEHFISAKADITFTPADFMQGTSYVGTATKELKNVKWVGDYRHPAILSEIPAALKGHFVSMHIHETKPGEAAVELTVRVVAEEKDKDLHSQASARTDFAAKRIEVSGDFYIRPIKKGVEAKGFSMNLTSACERIK